MAYLDNSGLSYFWSKIKALFGQLKITTGGPNSVGTAKVGTAKTAVPAYTPSGEVRLRTTETEVISITGANLDYSRSNYKLYINGVTLQTAQVAIAIPTGATFEGNGVTFNIEQET